jgi:hypothetical protein
VSFICHIDIESFSKVNLKQTGVYRYAEDDSTEILCIAFAFGDEPPNFWIPDPLIPRELQREIALYVHNAGGLIHIGFRRPQRLTWHARNKGQFRAHNSQFERVMLNGSGYWLSKNTSSAMGVYRRKSCIAFSAPRSGTSL